MVEKYIRGENNPVNTEVFNKILHGGFFFSRLRFPEVHAGRTVVRSSGPEQNMDQLFSVLQQESNNKRTESRWHSRGEWRLQHTLRSCRRLKSLIYQIIYNVYLAKLMKLPFHWYSSLMRMQHKKVVHLTFVCVHKQHIIFMIKIRVQRNNLILNTL